MPQGVRKRFEGTLTTAANGQTIDKALTVGGFIQGVGQEEIWDLVDVYVEMTTNGGSAAASWEFSISEASGWTDRALTERYTNLNNPVATKITESNADFGELSFKCDANAQVHIRGKANAAATGGNAHVWTYVLTFEKREGR